MKQGTYCDYKECGVPLQWYQGFWINIRKPVENPLTGEIKEVEYKAKWCAECTRKAKYKVGKKHFNEEVPNAENTG